MIKLERKHGCILIDEADYENIRSEGYRIEVSRKKQRDTFYLEVSISKGNPPNRIRKNLARHILGLNDRNVFADHIDRNSLNNTRENLRAAKFGQNIQNRGKAKKNKATSRFKGVCWDKSEKKWIAYIGLNGKLKNLGRFENELDAANAYDDAAKKHFGEFAVTNANLMQEVS
jgi:hypothetical protein